MGPPPGIVAVNPHSPPCQNLGKFAAKQANRKSFYKKFFPRKTVSPETFDVTLNVVHLAEDRLADALVPLPRLAGETDA